MFHTFYTGVYSIHVLHMLNYMCNTGVYSTHVLHMVNYMCKIGLYSTHVLHMVNYICNKAYILHIYFTSQCHWFSRCPSCSIFPASIQYLTIKF